VKKAMLSHSEWSLIMNKVLKLKIIIFIILLTSNLAFAEKEKVKKMKLTFIEYARGVSSSTNSTIHLSTVSKDLYFYDVHLIDNSFFPDNSIIPNAFLKPLFKGDIVGAVKATTEPYYGIRIYHFLKNKPQIGFGIDFIHFKVFLPDEKQTVKIKGTKEGENINLRDDVHNYLESFNVSHGVNHIGFSIIYRKRLYKNEKFPDGKLQPYVSFHIAPCIPHHEVQIKDSELKAYSYQIKFPNFGFGLGAGLRVRIYEHFGLFLEYKYTYTFLRNLVFDNGEGKIQLNFGVHHLQWGFSISI